MSQQEIVKFELEERKFPFFTDEEIDLLLTNNYGVVELAVRDGLIKKARVDSIKLPSGLEKPNNREYWLTLAKFQMDKFNAKLNSGAYDNLPDINAIKQLSKSGKFKILKRADEV